MCVEYQLADKRLQQWVNWLYFQSESNLRVLGYPTRSPEQKIPGSKNVRTLSINRNPEAEEVEKLMRELKIKWSAVYQALIAYYFMGLSIRAAADHNNISPLTFQKYYGVGMGWMEAKLSR